MGDALDRESRTPLHYAAADGDLETVRKLLATGVDVNRGDQQGWTPLHFAAQANSASVVAELLAAGAEVDAQDQEGNTPLGRAVFNSQGQGDVIKLLRQHGADPRILNHHGRSPLELARQIANYDVIRHFEDLD